MNNNKRRPGPSGKRTSSNKRSGTESNSSKRSLSSKNTPRSFSGKSSSKNSLNNKRKFKRDDDRSFDKEPKKFSDSFSKERPGKKSYSKSNSASGKSSSSFDKKKFSGEDRSFKKKSFQSGKPDSFEDKISSRSSSFDKKKFSVGDRPFKKKSFQSGKTDSFEGKKSSRSSPFDKKKFSGEERRFVKKGREKGFKHGKGNAFEDKKSKNTGSFKERESSRVIQTPSYKLEKPQKPKTKSSEIQAPAKENDTLRLNKLISNSGICSRRDADLLIQKGEITVNGQVVTELGYKVNKNDIVKYKGRALRSEKSVYVLLNKPKDFLTTTEDPLERRTVMALVANACNERIYPVGRLDRNTTGLLLLTNDGELAEKLTHPSNNIKKVYQAELDKPLTKEVFDEISSGFDLEDGPVTVDEVVVLTKDKKTIGLEIHEGRNRIVRRIFEHFGYEVVKLDRVMYAGLTKKDLPRGKWRYLSEKEVIHLKYFL